MYDPTENRIATITVDNNNNLIYITKWNRSWLDNSIEVSVLFALIEKETNVSCTPPATLIALINRHTRVRHVIRLKLVTGIYFKIKIYNSINNNI